MSKLTTGEARKVLFVGGLAGLVAASTASEGFRLATEMLGSNEHFKMANSICSDIVEAETMGDIDQERLARKAALSWVFAETAIFLAPKVGYADVGQGLERYLYGDGSVLDLTDEMKQLGKEKYFWNDIFTSAFSQIMKDNFGKYSELIDSKLNSVMKFFADQVKNGVSFTARASTDYDGQDGNNLFYAIGISNYQLQSSEIKILGVEDNKIKLGLGETKVGIEDIYDWKTGDFSPGLIYLNEIIRRGMDAGFDAIGIDNLLEKVISESGVAAWQRDLLLDNFASLKNDIYAGLVTVSNNVALNIERRIVGDDPEVAGRFDFDLSLLTEYGAKPYPIQATVNFEVEDSSIEMSI